MQFFTTILHIVLCISLILIILLQPGKDGASVFGGGGGGGNQMYGPRGQGHFLGKATTVIAATFMFTSITLAFYSRPNEEGSSETVDAIRKLEQSDTQLAVGSTNADKDRQDALNQPMSMNFDKGMETDTTQVGSGPEGLNNTVLPGLPEDFQSLTPEQQQVVLEQLLQQAGPTGLPSSTMPMVPPIETPGTDPGSGTSIPAPALEEPAPALEENDPAAPEGENTDSPNDSQPADVVVPETENTVSTTSDSEPPSTTIDRDATEQ